MSSISDWERKRTLEKLFQHVPPHQRTEIMERWKKEQDKMDKENGKNGKGTVSVKAPDKPAFLKKEGKKFSGYKDKKYEPASPDDARKPGETMDAYIARLKKMYPDKKLRLLKNEVVEVVTGQLGMVTPRPMWVNTLPGTEVRGAQSHSAETSAGGMDNHTHQASYDSAGNGATLPDNTGHIHDVRSFMVSDYQYPDGGTFHGHPGQLPVPETTPGSVYKNYDGELM